MKKDAIKSEEFALRSKFPWNFSEKFYILTLKKKSLWQQTRYKC